MQRSKTPFIQPLQDRILLPLDVMVMAQHGPWQATGHHRALCGEQGRRAVERLQLQLGPPPVPPLGVIPDRVAGPHPANIRSKQILLHWFNKSTNN